MEGLALVDEGIPSSMGWGSMIGKIIRRPLREVWKHEALDFTTWLVENIDVLSEALDLPLQDAKREQAAEDFSVDLVAEDDSGNTVVIENQLGKSDHDHLGKVVTYLAALDARVAVWIVSEPRPEHTKAITWLNESQQAGFYLVKAEAICIDDSAPACLFTLITGPSDETREVGETKKEIADRYAIRRRFWEMLLDRARQKTKLYNTLSPTNDNWIAFASGKPGLSFQTSITQHAATAQLVIDRGKDSAAENRKVLDHLKSHKAEIEQDFGGPLEWYEPEGVRLCRVIHEVKVGGYKDEEANWPKIQDAIIDAMVRLEKAFSADRTIKVGLNALPSARYVMTRWQNSLWLA
jgi:hypothetical protein